MDSELQKAIDIFEMQRGAKMYPGERLIVEAARDAAKMVQLVEDFLGSLTETEGCSPPPDYEFDKDLCPELAALYLAMYGVDPSEGSHAEG